MKNKLWAIYEDFIVREFNNKKSLESSDLLGTITIKDSLDTFQPEYFSASKKGQSVILREMKISTSAIKLNQFFSLISIQECPESNHKSGRKYYRELQLTIEDISGNKRTYFEHKSPEDFFSYNDLQNLLKDTIVSEIDSFSTYKEIDLTKEINLLKSTG